MDATWSPETIEQALQARDKLKTTAHISGVVIGVGMGFSQLKRGIRTKDYALAATAPLPTLTIICNAWITGEVSSYLAAPSSWTGGRRVGGMLPTSRKESVLVEGPNGWPCLFSKAGACFERVRDPSGLYHMFHADWELLVVAAMGVLAVAILVVAAFIPQMVV